MNNWVGHNPDCLGTSGPAGSAVYMAAQGLTRCQQMGAGEVWFCSALTTACVLLTLLKSRSFFQLVFGSFKTSDKRSDGEEERKTHGAVLATQQFALFFSS